MLHYTRTDRSRGRPLRHATELSGVCMNMNQRCMLGRQAGLMLLRGMCCGSDRPLLMGGLYHHSWV